LKATRQATKPSKHAADAPDVPADNPEGTMDRFREGLRRVLTVRKVDVRREPAHRPAAPRGAYNKRFGKPSHD
jgi:hypothetical protein